MIVIFSEDNDWSTIEVMNWLIYRYKKDVIRVNLFQKITISYITRKDNQYEIKFEINNQNFMYSEIESVWFRRSSLNLNLDIKKETFFEIPDYKNFFLNQELESINTFVNFLLFKKKCLGNPFLLNINKSIVNYFALESGLNLPNDILLSSKKQLSSFYNQSNGLIIAKSFNTNFTYLDKIENKVYQIYTNRVKRKEIKNSNSQFFYSYFQEEIIKSYEIRVFYIAKKCYSMAIFSQVDKKTQIDFRRYNRIKPNRTTPYKLPNELEEKLHNLMNKLKLNCGSIDILKSINGKYYFLEVNPIGQFGMVSYPCNYNLSKVIAEYLI